MDGVADPRDRPTLKARIFPVTAKLMFPNDLIELVGMTDAVTRSDLDWTLARITRASPTPRACCAPATSDATTPAWR